MIDLLRVICSQASPTSLLCLLLNGSLLFCHLIFAPSLLRSPKSSETTDRLFCRSREYGSFLLIGVYQNRCLEPVCTYPHLAQMTLSINDVVYDSILSNHFSR